MGLKLPHAVSQDEIESVCEGMQEVLVGSVRRSNVSLEQIQDEGMSRVQLAESCDLNIRKFVRIHRGICWNRFRCFGRFWGFGSR